MIKNYVVNKVDHYTIQYMAQSDRTVKLYAIRRPVDPHGGGASQSHVFADNSICVSAGNAPRSMDRAEAIAHFWMSGYSAYIRDPQKRFPNGSSRVVV